MSNKMTEKDRNKELMLLLQKLLKEEDYKSIQLLKTMVKNDTPSMQKSYSIIAE